MRSLRRTLGPLVVLVALAGAAPVRAANIDSNLAVAPATQANGGGCYPVSIAPSLLDMLTLIDPEWAAVDVGAQLPPLSAPIAVHGTVALSKINEGGDFPSDHVTDDQNTLITVDAADEALVATGNVGPEGVEAGTLEVEWELGKYPLFAWAGAGDRFTGLGRWIWDCGHPSANPAGSCSTTTTQSCLLNRDCRPPTCPTCVAGETCGGITFNYHSEIHPPQAVAISRIGGYAFSPRFKSGRLSTRTDVWISPDGGGAGDQCLLTHLASSLSLLSLECFPLSQPVANVNAANFAFDIPLPPRPAGNTRKPLVRVKEQTSSGLPRPRVTTTFVDGPTPVVHAEVDMTTPIAGQLPSLVGKTIIARWFHDPTPVTRLRIDVTAVEIANPLKAVTPVLPARQVCSVTTTQDCSATPCPAGESCLTIGGPTPGWLIFLEANGNWQAVPGLAAVATPTTVAQSLRYDVGVPAGGSLHLHATGKSLACLESQLYGQSLARDVALYGLTDGATCLADTSRDIGKLDVSFGGPDFGSGSGSASHVTPSVGGDGGACSTTTTQLCLTNADCPSGETCTVTGSAFKLHYTITKLH
jgi:hypothetical protein